MVANLNGKGLLLLRPGICVNFGLCGTRYERFDEFGVWGLGFGVWGWVGWMDEWMFAELGSGMGGRAGVEV